MNREDIKNCLKQTISNMTLEEFSRLFINEVTAVEEFYKLCNNKKAGNTISLLFNPHRLNIITEASVTRTSAPMSIYQSLSDKGNELYTEKITNNPQTRKIIFLSVFEYLDQKKYLMLFLLYLHFL